jgi:hypothetical protein
MAANGFVFVLLCCYVLLFVVIVCYVITDANVRLPPHPNYLLFNRQPSTVNCQTVLTVQAQLQAVQADKEGLEKRLRGLEEGYARSRQQGEAAAEYCGVRYCRRLNEEESTD